MGMLQNKNTVAHAEREIIVNRLVLDERTVSQGGNITNELWKRTPTLKHLVGVGWTEFSKFSNRIFYQPLQLILLLL